VLRIRLRRTGAKKQPRYRVVVAESSAPRDGAYVEVLGWYNPQAEPTQIQVDTDKAAEWIKRGAQPSERVANLLKRAAVAAAPEIVPEEAPTPTRARRTRAAKEEPSADEAPESAGSAASVVTSTTEPESTGEPESEGSAGAPPA
jgi:small subunit ribosomal protein S16